MQSMASPGTTRHIPMQSMASPGTFSDTTTPFFLCAAGAPVPAHAERRYGRPYRIRSKLSTLQNEEYSEYPRSPSVRRVLAVP